MNEGMKRWLMLGLVALTVLVGLNFGGQTANAKMKTYRAVPTALRGNWYTKHWGKPVYLKLTKYTEKESGSTLSMKTKNRDRQFCVKGKTKAGYYMLGLASGDMPQRFKPVKHHGKKALKSYAFNPIKNKIIHFYYYKK
ncbi:hypothetical protein [Levilactobacillus angrenensis]|uniref:Extracellular protein n=1 Tax=Levilactobacillus angrenensis TaxID=2486020 RepID=A0ABW1U7Z6_9LACO|nr:hypothetical protein [Levilactobacillus angrenensis]